MVANLQPLHAACTANHVVLSACGGGFHSFVATGNCALSGLSVGLQLAVFCRKRKLIEAVGRGNHEVCGCGCTVLARLVQRPQECRFLESGWISLVDDQFPDGPPNPQKNPELLAATMGQGSPGYFCPIPY